jgi:predicted dienelactone hydrolase
MAYKRGSVRTGKILFFLAVIFVFSGLEGALAEERALNAGFRQMTIQDPFFKEPFPVSIWYPTAMEAKVTMMGPYEMVIAPGAMIAKGKFGLIVISHGSGSGSLNHRDLAIHLAAHGYVVAAPEHPKDNYRDMSGVGSYEVWAGRPRQISATIDALLGDQVFGLNINPGRIGVVGHSSGGYTALAVIGGKADMANLLRHCKDHPDDANFCSFGGARTRQAASPIPTTTAIPDLLDRRVKAAVAMAPVGALFDASSFEGVNLPVRIYCADRDTLLPCRTHAEKIYKSLSREAEYVVLQNANHYSFIAPFPESIKGRVGEAAQDPDGFDRAALHAKLNPDILDFFDRKLK